jgi:hypothetical protein
MARLAPTRSVLRRLSRLPPPISQHRIPRCDAPLEAEHSIMTHQTFPADDPERAPARTIAAVMVSELECRLSGSVLVSAPHPLRR